MSSIYIIRTESGSYSDYFQLLHLATTDLKTAIRQYLTLITKHTLNEEGNIIWDFTCKNKEYCYCDHNSYDYYDTTSSIGKICVNKGNSSETYISVVQDGVYNNINHESFYIKNGFFYKRISPRQYQCKKCNKIFYNNQMLEHLEKDNCNEITPIYAYAYSLEIPETMFDKANEDPLFLDWSLAYKKALQKSEAREIVGEEVEIV